MWGTDLNRTQNPDNATVGSPSTWPGVMSIASAENCEIHTPYFSLSDGTMIFFTGTYEWVTGEAEGMELLIGEEAEYVIIDGLGAPEDYFDEEGNSLVEGKIAVVYRGQLSFGEKIYNAEMAGAIGCVVVNNSAEDIYSFYMNTQLTDEYGDPFYPAIPACMIMMDDGEKMAACETKTMVVAEQTAARPAEGGQMSSFSSWGVSPDLRLVPDITGIGGNVYSTVDNGKYGVMSGTSMSAPQVAGVTALMMQHLYLRVGSSLFKVMQIFRFASVIDQNDITKTHIQQSVDHCGQLFIRIQRGQHNADLIQILQIRSPHI
jgi:subtilisin family serine protease